MSEKPEPILSTVLNVLGTIAIVTSAFHFMGAPGNSGAAKGRLWTQEQLDKVGKGCGVVTSMPRQIAETYAANPGYYGSTFCCGCGTYLPVGSKGEFVWDGTDERVGT